MYAFQGGLVGYHPYNGIMILFIINQLTLSVLLDTCITRNNYLVWVILKLYACQPTCVQNIQKSIQRNGSAKLSSKSISFCSRFIPHFYTCITKNNYLITYLYTTVIPHPVMGYPQMYFIIGVDRPYTQCNLVDPLWFMIIVLTIF